VRPEDVDGVIEGLRRRMVAYESMARAAKWGDMAIVDYNGTVEGKPVEGGSAKDAMVTIGGGGTLRALEEALVGRKAGDHFEVSFAYPADYGDKALAGKNAGFSVSVKEIKEGKLPPLDDEFAKAAGQTGTLEELRTNVVARLRAERERESLDRLKDTVVERLLRFAPPEVAPSLVEEEMNMMAMRRLEELRRQGVRSLEQLQLKPRDYVEMFRGAAVRAVREAFVLDAVQRDAKVEVSEEDVEKEVRAGAGADRMEADRLVSSLKADGRWERLKHRLAQDRTLDWVIGQSKVTERAVCP
jgi:trigger factor